MERSPVVARLRSRSTRRVFVGGALALMAGASQRTRSALAASAWVISRGSTSRAEVALTFDCGADRGYTDSILNTLANKGVRASFGVTGAFADAHPDAVARMVRDGHDLINHSYGHASYTGFSSSTALLTTRARQDDLARAEQAIVNASGRSTKPLFRPPFGDYDTSVLNDIGNAGYSVCVMWSIDVRGWAGLTYDQVVSRALGNHGNGYIYLLHVGSQSQEGPALPAIIDGLRSRGYGFVRISQMTGTSPAPAPTTPSPTGHAPGTKLKVTAALWLRSSAGLSGSVLATMPVGTVVTVVSGPSPSGGYTWYQVDTPYGRGWAAGEFLQVTSSSSPPPPSPTGHAPGTKLKVTTQVRLRSAPSLDGAVLATMAVGTICTVVSGPRLSGGYTWYQVDSSYGRGWAAGEFMQVTSSSSPSPSPSGHAPGTKLKVTAALWLRSSAGLSGAVLATMPTGTVVTVVSGPVSSGGYTWYQVDTPYGRGWAAGQFLQVTTAAPSPAPTTPTGHAPGTKLKVTAALWLRSSAGLSGSVLATMPTGTVVTVVSGPSPSGGYTWYQVDSPYGRGWAAGEFLARV